MLDEILWICFDTVESFIAEQPYCLNNLILNYKHYFFKYLRDQRQQYLIPKLNENLWNVENIQGDSRNLQNWNNF